MTAHKKQLIDYVKVYKQAISSEICNESIKNLEQATWHQEQFYRPRDDQNVTPTECLDVSFDILKTNDQIKDAFWKSLEKYILQDYKCDWQAGWEGFSSPKYNRYTKNNAMQIHCDHIHSLFDGQRKGIPILTVLGLLNNQFKGGQFQMFDDEIIELNQGDVLVFPSNFLYPHKVLPIIDGTRYTVVSWSW